MSFHVKRVLRRATPSSLSAAPRSASIDVYPCPLCRRLRLRAAMAVVSNALVKQSARIATASAASWALAQQSWRQACSREKCLVVDDNAGLGAAASAASGRAARRRWPCTWTICTEAELLILLANRLGVTVRFERGAKVEHTGKRIRVVGIGALEAKRLVKRDGGLHGDKRVEDESPVADLPRRHDGG